MTYAEIADQYPEDFAARDDDKYNYRYRGGESYRDVVIRLEPIIMELERSEDILIVTHQAVLRCIYAYFMKKDQAESPWMAVSCPAIFLAYFCYSNIWYFITFWSIALILIQVPLHTLIRLTPRAYGTEEVRMSAGIEAVSTWRGKGSTAKHEDAPTEAK